MRLLSVKDSNGRLFNGKVVGNVKSLFVTFVANNLKLIHYERIQRYVLMDAWNWRNFILPN